MIDPPPPNEPMPGVNGGSGSVCEPWLCFRPAVVALLAFAVIAVPVALWGGIETMKPTIAIYDHEDGKATVQMKMGDEVLHVVTWVNEPGDDPQDALKSARAQAERWNRWRGSAVPVVETKGGHEQMAGCRNLPAE